jgi:hypothetical protein
LNPLLFSGTGTGLAQSTESVCIIYQ